MICKILHRLRPKKKPLNGVSALNMSDGDFLSLFNLKPVRDMLEKDDVPTAKAALLNHYMCRENHTWPKPPQIITDLRLDLSKLSNQDLIELAESILMYHFSPDGTLPAMTSEGEIDWQTNPISSPQWLWRLNRHQWWPILGLAYQCTKDERYTSAFVSQMMSWVTQNPPVFIKNEKSPTWRLMETAMRMYVSWIPSFALFGKSSDFTDDAKLLMLRSIHEHAVFLSLYKTNRNHLLRESNGLAAIGIFFPEFKLAGKWKEVALSRIETEIPKQINQDGSQIELSPGYQWLVVDELERTFDLLENESSGDFRDHLADWLERMYNVLAYITRPDGTFPEINDGFIRWSCPRLAKAGEKLKRKDFVYIGTYGESGTKPEETSVLIRDAGWAIMRSGWKDQALYLFFDTGPYGGPHGHEDKLSIEVYAFGDVFITDSGSYTYEKQDPFRSYFVGSAAHNTVLVDHKSQVRRWQKVNMNPEPARGNYTGWVSNPNFDFAIASYGKNYGEFSMTPPSKPKVISDVVHTRKILFVKPHYWFVIDELNAEEPHTYQLLFHTVPGLKVHQRAGKKVEIENEDTRNRLQIIPLFTDGLDVSLRTGAEDPIQGWYSVDHHVKSPSTAIIYGREKSASGIFATCLYPFGAGQEDSAVDVEPVALGNGSGHAFAVSHNRGRDYLVFSDNEKTKTIGSYQSDSMCAVIQLDKALDLIRRFDWNYTNRGAI